VHYLSADVRTTPPEYQAFYTEKLALVPWTYLVNDHKQGRREVIGGVAPSRAALGFGGEDVVLACFNQLYKIEPEVYAAWMRILTRAPKARLWLLNFSKAASKYLRKAAAEAGVDPARIVFHDKFPKETELLAKGHADLFLDTPLFNAHTTGGDVLWAVRGSGRDAGRKEGGGGTECGQRREAICMEGPRVLLYLAPQYFGLDAALCPHTAAFAPVLILPNPQPPTPNPFARPRRSPSSHTQGIPVVTLPGENFAQRVASGLVHSVHQANSTIARTIDDYVRIVLALYRDTARRQALKRHLVDAREEAPLFDTRLLTRHVETTMKMMWEVYSAGLPRRHVIHASA
jgi:predicted O-linked N-acetylglucosamine transferase (SPINDLY family)